MSIEARKKLFTVDEFHRMGEAGILDPGARLELLDGEIVEMVPIGSPHAGGVNVLTERLVSQLAGRATVTVQNPVRLSDLSEPVPDVAVLRRREDFYRTAHPRPEDVYLIIEVADSSSRTDRRDKIPRYALADIAEVWLVDLVQGRVEVHTRPRDGAYVTVDVRGPGDTIAPEAFPDLALDVSGILGA